MSICNIPNQLMQLSNTFMKEMKAWTGKNISDKKMIKGAMQFGSFVRAEAQEVGRVAMDLKLPFDQRAALEVSLTYLKSQLNLSTLDIIDLKASEDVPERIVGMVSPGKPHLWIR